MSPNAAAPWLVYWYAALDTRLGVWLRSPEPARLIGRLYAARNVAHDPALAALTIRTSPADPEHEIFIVRVQQPAPLPETAPCAP